ncbi:unnamed protein product [Amoebophrya sp. A120]|nr:unnamed protein product [Amoebophrya sp. A120]|eukprot:GSA120T00012682001.1
MALILVLEPEASPETDVWLGFFLRLSEARGLRVFDALAAAPAATTSSGPQGPPTVEDILTKFSRLDGSSVLDEVYKSKNERTGKKTSSSSRIFLGVGVLLADGSSEENNSTTPIYSSRKGVDVAKIAAMVEKFSTRDSMPLMPILREKGILVDDMALHDDADLAGDSNPDPRPSFPHMTLKDIWHYRNVWPEDDPIILTEPGYLARSYFNCDELVDYFAFMQCFVTHLVRTGPVSGPCRFGLLLVVCDFFLQQKKDGIAELQQPVAAGDVSTFNTLLQNYWLQFLQTILHNLDAIATMLLSFIFFVVEKLDTFVYDFSGFEQTIFTVSYLQANFFTIPNFQFLLRVATTTLISIWATAFVNRVELHLEIARDRDRRRKLADDAEFRLGGNTNKHQVQEKNKPLTVEERIRRSLTRTQTSTDFRSEGHVEQLVVEAARDLTDTSGVDASEQQALSDGARDLIDRLHRGAIVVDKKFIRNVKFKLIGDEQGKSTNKETRTTSSDIMDKALRKLLDQKLATLEDSTEAHTLSSADYRQELLNVAESLQVPKLGPTFLLLERSYAGALVRVVQDAFEDFIDRQRRMVRRYATTYLLSFLAMCFLFYCQTYMLYLDLVVADLVATSPEFLSDAWLIRFVPKLQRNPFFSGTVFPPLQASWENVNALGCADLVRTLLLQVLLLTPTIGNVVICGSVLNPLFTAFSWHLTHYEHHISRAEFRRSASLKSAAFAVMNAVVYPLFLVFVADDANAALSYILTLVFIKATILGSITENVVPRLKILFKVLEVVEGAGKNKTNKAIKSLSSRSASVLHNLVESEARKSCSSSAQKVKPQSYDWKWRKEMIKQQASFGKMTEADGTTNATALISSSSTTASSTTNNKSLNTRRAVVLENYFLHRNFALQRAVAGRSSVKEEELVEPYSLLDEYKEVCEAYALLVFFFPLSPFYLPLGIFIWLFTELKADSWKLRNVRRRVYKALDLTSGGLCDAFVLLLQTITIISLLANMLLLARRLEKEHQSQSVFMSLLMLEHVLLFLQLYLAGYMPKAIPKDLALLREL